MESSIETFATLRARAKLLRNELNFHVDSIRISRNMHANSRVFIIPVISLKTLSDLHIKDRVLRFVSGGRASGSILRTTFSNTPRDMCSYPDTGKRVVF